MSTPPAMSPGARPPSIVFSPGGPTKKRKTSMDATTQNPSSATTTASGARRYRASRACQYCRTRKVRCDVLRTETECTNCRLDNRECILLESRRGKPDQWRNYGQETVEVRRSSAQRARRDSILVRDDTNDTNANVDPAIAEKNDNTPLTTDDVPMCVTFNGNDNDNDTEHDKETEKGDNDGEKNDGDADEHNENGSSWSTSAYTPPESLDALAFVFQDTSGASTSATSNQASTRTSSTQAPGSTTHDAHNTNSPSWSQYNYASRAPPPPLPSFIAPFRNKIPADDRAFLARKGALTVPEPDLRVAILRAYIFSVHPFMPMLDLEPFVRSVLSDESDKGDGGESAEKEKDERPQHKISLLLFQAVMFAGLSSLEPQHLHRLGFATAKQAREVFFVRVKLLYELDVEPDSAAVFQSLLLMSSWYSKWTEWKDTSHWTAQALLVAQNMGLHREPTESQGWTAAERGRRRRMWWSLFVRDRMIALGTRRPMRIRDEDFDVNMLSVEDFEVVGDDCSLLLSDGERRSTALMCIHLAKLCVCIGHVLKTQYTTLTTTPAVSHTTMVVPRRSKNVDDLQQCDLEIQAWQKQLADNIQLTNHDLTPCVDVHWAMLNLAHLTLVNVLHRTQALPPAPFASEKGAPSPETPETQNIRRASRLKVKDAACKVTKIATGMLQRGQIRFLGLNGITALLAACLSHMVDIRSASGNNDGDEDVRDASIFRFGQNMQVLYAMTSMYATADAAVSFLASVAKKVQLPIPAANGQATTISQATSSVSAPAPKRPSPSHRSMSMSSTTSASRPPRASLSHTNNTANNTNIQWTTSQQLTSIGDITASWDSMTGGKAYGNTPTPLKTPTMQSTHLSPQPLGLPSVRQPASLQPSAPLPGTYDTTMKDAGPLPGGRDHRTFSSYDDMLFDNLFSAAVSGTASQPQNCDDPDMALEPMVYNYDFFLDNFDLPDCQPHGME
ncbi:hypothetical protein Sste5346_008531 [Sporothrix stenoceras]|uniref:Zn(2)-C6 fungal-type domain-containing protein n=1 Tax=Sporothrix stenoceras TaxID=5173 RepID=A0ABR3YNZ0_9PEZI